MRSTGLSDPRSSSPLPQDLAQPVSGTACVALRAQRRQSAGRSETSRPDAFALLLPRSRSRTCGRALCPSVARVNEGATASASRGIGMTVRRHNEQCGSIALRTVSNSVGLTSIAVARVRQHLHPHPSPPSVSIVLSTSAAAPCKPQVPSESGLERYVKPTPCSGCTLPCCQGCLTAWPRHREMGHR